MQSCGGLWGDVDFHVTYDIIKKSKYIKTMTRTVICNIIFQRGIYGEIILNDYR